MSDFVVEKDIKMPEPMEGSKYPLAEMQVGDSFAVPNPNGDTKLAAAVRSATFRYGKMTSTKFSIRSLIEGDKQVLRVWRTA